MKSTPVHLYFMRPYHPPPHFSHFLNMTFDAVFEIMRMRTPMPEWANASPECIRIVLDSEGVLYIPRAIDPEDKFALDKIKALRNNTIVRTTVEI